MKDYIQSCVSVPGNWATAPLKELCSFHNGLWKGKKEPFETATVIRNTNFTADGKIDLADVAVLEVEAKQLAKRRLIKNDIIIEKSGGGPKQPVGRVVLFDLDEGVFSFSNFTSAIRVEDIQRIDPVYLHRVLHYWYTSGRTEQLQSHSTGITNLDFHTYKELEVPLPPLEEQKRIVAVLDQAFAALDCARAHVEANLTGAEEFLASYIEAELKASGGKVLSLQELLDAGAVTGHLDGNHGNDYPRKEEFVSDGVPYISANCIVAQEIDISRAKFLSDARAAQFRKGVAQDRDVIFAHNATVGPVALLRTDFKKVILSTSVTYYRCNTHEILPEFLVYEMRGANFRRQYEMVMRQATRNQVPITAQRKLTHTVPSIDEQKQLVAKCAEVESLSRDLGERYSQELRDLADLRQSLLQQAFSGRLNA